MPKTKIIELMPIKESTQDYERIEARIKKAFRKIIYEPLLRQLSLPLNKLKNSDEYLIDAMRKGKITYSKGAFRGKFNSTLTLELKALGAKWDKKTSSFKIDQAKLPYAIREGILTSETFFQDQLDLIDGKLAQITPEDLIEHIRTADLFDSVLWKVEKDFQKSIKNLTVTPQLPEAQRAKIAQEWQNNMDLWIKDFTEDHIKELRETVQKSVYAGNRYESLVKGIQSSYGVTARKAKFLARQETSLLMAKFKETRYTAAGVNEYKWVCVKMPHDKSPDQHTPGYVRYYHGILDGTIQRWDDPPVTNKNPERRNNAGADYNCRCFARALIRF